MFYPSHDLLNTSYHPDRHSLFLVIALHREYLGVHQFRLPSFKDGPFNAGVMVGTILCVTGARGLGVHYLIGLISGVIVGAGLGYVLQQAYINSKGPPPRE